MAAYEYMHKGTAIEAEELKQYKEQQQERAREKKESREERKHEKELRYVRTAVDRAERKKTKQERILALKKKIAMSNALKRRLKRDKNVTGLVRGLASAFTPRVKISPQGRRALISQAFQQSEDYNARNTFFKKRDTSKVSFLGRGNV